MVSVSSRLGGVGSAVPGPANKVRARCRSARWWLVVVGLPGYLLVGLLASLALVNVVRAFDSDISPAGLLGIAGAIALVAAWRGLTVAASVQADGVQVRNRWRRVVVPFGDITAVEVRSSTAYGFVGFALSLWVLLSPQYGALDEDVIGPSDLLVIRRGGHRRGVPLQATLGMSRHLDEMQPFIEALSSHGHDVVLGGPDPSGDLDTSGRVDLA